MSFQHQHLKDQFSLSLPFHVRISIPISIRTIKLAGTISLLNQKILSHTKSLLAKYIYHSETTQISSNHTSLERDDYDRRNNEDEIHLVQVIIKITYAHWIRYSLGIRKIELYIEVHYYFIKILLMSI